ncbi:CHAT domain-containing protein [Streptomyces longispororuber]|uniref:CHAT domain-containing protein n=1 Tax=Streptomyces longispororuber TaxID=68230 RepID=UPI003401027B
MLRNRRIARALALVERLQDGEDTGAALAADVDRLIARLRGAVRPDRQDLEVRQVLGWLHWYRHEAHTRHRRYVEAGAERALAYAYLEPVYRADPLAVPERMEHLFIRGAVSAPEGAEARLHAALAATHAIEADDDLDAVERTSREVERLLAVPLTVPGLTGVSSCTLGIALYQKALRSGAAEADVLDEAVAHFRRARALLEASTVEPLLGTALLRRYHLRGDRQDLASATAHLRSAAESGSAQPDPDAYAALAEALHHQYLVTGLGEDLAEAVAAARASVGPGGSPATKAPRLHLLATLLRLRGSGTGDADSLQEAVRVAREALDHTTGRARAASLQTLGRALVACSRETDTRPFLDEAVDVFRQALALLDEADTERIATLGDLAGALVEGHRATGTHLTRDTALARIDEAVALWREALALSAGGQGRGLLWGNLGSGLRARYEWEQDPRTLDEMVDAYRRALDEPAHLRDWPEARGRHELGNALSKRYEARRDPRDRAEAVRAARAAATAPDADPELRLTAAQLWGNRAAAQGDWAEALKGYRVAIEALPHTASPALHRYDQERRLSNTFVVASDAAAAALQTGEGGAEEALELLEAGRGVLLRSVLRAGDADVAALTTAEPDLAAELAGLQQQLTSRHLSMDRRHALAADWNRVGESVRRRPGFERFLLPPTAEEARTAASDGPVITVNVSEARCDALVLTGADLTVVPLAGLRHADLVERCERFSAALSAAESTSAGLLAGLRAQDVLRETLAWLWDVVAEPVLTALDLTRPVTGDGPWPRVWWSPTGRLTTLPLHAAGHHEPGGPAVLDRAVSSYTPTVRTLIGARRRAGAGPRRPARILAVGLSDTPGHLPLSATLHEAASLGGPALPPLVNERATRRAVLDALAACDWAHFACHAHMEEGYASASRLILHDQPVTVTDVDRLRLAHAELAYLSACSTASAPVALSGEALHLGSAFHLAGFQHVVATLWNVQDKAAARIAHTFYEHLPRHTALPFAAPATALHHAVRRLREEAPTLPSRWAAHYHTGP